MLSTLVFLSIEEILGFGKMFVSSVLYFSPHITPPVEELKLGLFFLILKAKSCL